MLLEHVLGGIVHRVLVVGCGGWGTKVVARLYRMEGVEIVGIVDPALVTDFDWANEAANLYASIGEASPAGATHAIVCTPPYTGRLQMVSELLEIGVDHIHLAKPACVDVEEADELVALDGDACKISVGHTTLYQPLARRVMSQLQRMNRHRLHVRMTRDNHLPPMHDADPIVDLAAHDFAFLCDTLGYSARIIDAERRGDTYRISVAWPTGATATITGGWNLTKSDRSLQAWDDYDDISYDETSQHASWVKTDPHGEYQDALGAELTAFFEGRAYAMENARRIVQLLADAVRAADVKASV